MEKSESENMVKTVINSARITIAEFYSYAKRRKLFASGFINQVQQNITVETVD
ncbi:MAG: hypothetical protein KAI33_09320 [Elusimicrobiales bacterium]|nr:hypothetical protein [Elusimicrobiales bacterium]